MNIMTYPSRGTSLTLESVDAFMSITRIYLSTTERVTELTLSANLGAIDDILSASEKVLTIRQEDFAEQLPVVLTTPLLSRALDYSSEVLNVVTRAQVEAMTVFGARLTHQAVSVPDTVPWGTALNSLSYGIEEYARNAERIAAGNAVRAGHNGGRVTKSTPAG